MKRNIISFVFVLMPLILLCGSHGWTSGPAAKQIPAFNRDYRAWHMMRFIKQNYENSQFVNSDKGDFYYQESYPGEADSLDIQTWETTGQAWVPYKRQIYNYFPGHEYVGWIEEKMMNQTPPQTVRNEFISYDDQNRLDMAVLYENNTSSQQRNQVFRMYVIYVSNSDYEIYQWKAADGSDPARYHHITFEYDNWGRVIWEHEQISPDSLNWTDYSRTHHGYLTEDTTTGDRFVYRFSHEMPFLIFNGGSPNFGMQNQATNELWNGNQWVYNWKDTYYLDLYHTHISQILEEIYQNSVWVGQNRDTYTYDTNGNYTEILSEYWDSGSNTWMTGDRNIFTWGQYISTDDNIVPDLSELNVTAYPNPFRENINLSTASKVNSLVHYAVYNLKGECVAKHDAYPADSWLWNGINQTGNRLAAGIYFVQARQGTAHTVKRILLMR